MSDHALSTQSVTVHQQEAYLSFLAALRSTAAAYPVLRLDELVAIVATATGYLISAGDTALLQQMRALAIENLDNGILDGAQFQVQPERMECVKSYS